MACKCNDSNVNCYHITMGCVEPVVANANHYYTKSEVDEKLDEIVVSGGGITSGEVQSMIDASIAGKADKSEIPTVPTDVSAFNNDVPYLTEHQSLSGYATKDYVSGYTYDKATIDEKVASGGTFDPTQYYTTAQTDSLLADKLDASAYTPTDLSDYWTSAETINAISYTVSGMASQSWVINNYSTNTEVLQYIDNLQQQINSLQAAISGCCGGGGSGETIYRWITMTGENDYECSGTTKMTKEKKQQSTNNGVTWEDVSPLETRTGDTVLEENCADCGYVEQVKFRGKLLYGNDVVVNCNSATTLTSGETYTTNAYTSIEIGNCVSVIGDHAFQNQVYLRGNLVLPNSLRTIEENAFTKCDGLSAVTFNNGLETIGQGAFVFDTGFTEVNIPDSVKTIGVQAFYLHNLVTITIGSGITSIGDEAFATTEAKRQDIHYAKILATTPPNIGSDALLGTSTFQGSYPIYVPSESVNDYKTAWTGYASRIQAIPND